jgi:chromosome segregation ATPase
VQIEQQNVTIAEFEHQMVQMNEQVQNSIEEYDLQVSSLKGQVQAANQKLMQVEGQVSTQKFSEGNLHEQLQSAKDQITRFQEDQRIQSLKLENRERELQELK